MTSEQVELQRLCHQRTVENHESGKRRADHATLAAAHAFLAEHPPLVPLGDGAPRAHLTPQAGDGYEVITRVAGGFVLPGWGKVEAP